MLDIAKPAMKNRSDNTFNSLQKIISWYPKFFSINIVQSENNVITGDRIDRLLGNISSRPCGSHPKVKQAK